MPDAPLIAEATRWRVVLPVGVLKGITETDAHRLGREHGVRPDRAWVRLYADGTEVLGPWSPTPSLGSPAGRARDEPTWEDCTAVAEALTAAPGTGEIWRDHTGDITGAPLSLARVAVEALIAAGRLRKAEG